MPSSTILPLQHSQVRRVKVVRTDFRWRTHEGPRPDLRLGHGRLLALNRAERAGQDAALPEATFSLTTVSMSTTSAAERESVLETPRIVAFWIPTAGRSSEDRWRIDDLVRHL